MILRLLNGLVGEPERVTWKANKTAPLEPDKLVHRVDYCLGELDGAGKFQPLTAVQSIRIPAPAPLAAIEQAIRVEAGKLQQRLQATQPTVTDLVI